MLVNRSIHILGQIATKVNNLSRNSALTQIHRQIQQHQQQQVRAISGLTQIVLRPTAQSNLNTNKLKGSLCLVLLPVSAISFPSTLQGSTVPTVLFSSSSSTKADKADYQSYSTDSTDMAATDYKNANSIYDFTVKDTHGNDVSLEKYKGHVVLIVNIASQCGLTKNNYKKLTDLKEKFHDKGLRILNFPCNQFGSQMPEQDGEAMVCHLRDAKADIGDVFQKVDVNGSGAIPLYQYLKHKQGGTLGSAIKWNFTKFLVNKEGIPVNRYAPTTDPMDIAKDIEALL